MFRKNPLIVILGSTGTGKTKLSIELAERFGGEIISADSMQVYSNLDIVTAKATKEEQNRAKHHLLDVAEPTKPFTVVHFRNAALPIIDKLLQQSKLPIVVGGTNYYIESLLWDILVTNPPSSSPPPTSKTENTDPGVEDTTNVYSNNSTTPSDNYDLFNLNQYPVEKLYEELKSIDVTSSNRIHPNNKRKIIRALEVYKTTGITLTEILNEQRNKPGGNRLGGPLRYPHTIFFWLRCNQDILNDRLYKRVDSMVQDGLLKEIRHFYEKYLRNTSEIELTKGYLQSIGFKEFIPYLEKFDSKNDELIEGYLKKNSYQILEKADDQPEGLDILKLCLDQLKLVTQRYSKKQIKWIKNRFLESKDRQVPPLYSLDTSNVKLWNNNVYEPALNVIESYMVENSANLLPLEKTKNIRSELNEEVTNYCDICERYFIGEYQFMLHLKSNKHKKRKEGIKRRAKNNQEIEKN